mgnify:CR=1 FL=1
MPRGYGFRAVVQSVLVSLLVCGTVFAQRESAVSTILVGVVA